MNKKYIWLIGAFAALAAIYFITDRQNETTPRQNGEQALATTPETTTQEPGPATNTNYHPVSIPGLGQKELAGGNLSLVRVLAETPQYTRHYITYNSGNLKISGIMNVPKGIPPEGGYPLLVLNHGYIDPAVYTNGRGLRREQDYLAKQGFVVLHPDYRGHAESDNDPNSEHNIRTGYIEDVLNAVDAVKKSDLSFINKDKVGMLGHSMGGGITLGVITAKPDLVQAAVLFAPVSSHASDSYYRWTEQRTEVARKIRETYGSPEENKAFWDNVSPRNFFDRVTAPVQIHHGTADADVPVEWSHTTESALKQAGKNATLHIYQGQPHEFTSSWNQVMQRTTEFFKQHLSL